MAIEKLSVILELVTGNYNREARQAATATGAIGNSAKSVTGSLGAMIGPAAIAGAVVGLGKMALAAGENADRLFDLAAQTGLSTDELQRWEFVAKAAGASTEVFSDAVKAIIKNLSEAANGTGAAADAYERLGISVKDANGNLREGGEITAEVFDKLAGMTNITERNALAQDIFGKKWEETISILDLGSEALGELREEGAKGVISAEALRNADKFRETWQKFTATIGPKLNELLGKVAPLMTDVAEAAIEIVEELEPLFDAIGFLGESYDDLKAKGEDMAASDNIIISGWGRMIGELGILDVLTGNLSDSVVAAIFPLEGMAKATDKVVVSSNEVHDSWNAAALAEQALIASLGPTITLLNNQHASHRNVAAAAAAQRTAIINLANAQTSLVTPVGNVIRLQQELETAQEALTTAQADGKTSADELALAQIAVAEAMNNLQAAGLALTPDQIQAFAQLLITQFGQSEQQVLDTLKALNLLDGWTGTATFTLEMVNNASGGGGVNPLNDVFAFHSGGVVPGRRGSDQLILAQGGEGIIPLSHMGGNVTRNGPTINVYHPNTYDLNRDIQLASIRASVTNLVEAL